MPGSDIRFFNFGSERKIIYILEDRMCIFFIARVRGGCKYDGCVYESDYNENYTISDRERMEGFEKC